MGKHWKPEAPKPAPVPVAPVVPVELRKPKTFREKIADVFLRGKK